MFLSSVESEAQGGGWGRGIKYRSEHKGHGREEGIGSRGNQNGHI